MRRKTPNLITNQVSYSIDQRIIANKFKIRVTTDPSNSYPVCIMNVEGYLSSALSMDRREAVALAENILLMLPA